MPATEQTWRDTRALHVVFGISSIVMFVSTVWLLAADHYREWKDYQRTFQEIEAWTLVSRENEQDTTNYEAEKRRLEAFVDQTIVVRPDKKQVEAFVLQMKQFGDDPDAHAVSAAAIEQAYATLEAALQAAADDPAGEPDLAGRAARARPLREDLLEQMQKAIRKVKFEEDRMAGKLKFRKADMAKWQSQYDLGVRDGLRVDELDEVKQKLLEIQTGSQEGDTGSIRWYSQQYDAAKQQRTALDAIYQSIAEDQLAAEKNLKDFQASLKQLQQTLAEKTAFGRGALEMPIIDAFGRPLKIEQIWLPNLTLNNNFREVARFDRCTTCHQGIDKTAPGSAVEPGYPPLQPPQDLVLATPDQQPPGETDADGNEVARTTQAVYGFEIAEVGAINPTDVAVEFVWPRSQAAEAGLQRGDVITHIQVGDRMEKIVDRGQALRYLVQQAPWGQPLRITVRRGFPHPYSSHPRLDLFVGSLSPHAMMDVGCTICHDGQGSATQFKYANHSPNTPQQAAEWSRDHGWFDNHHWIFPMRPKRFVESSCLKCHHEVTELEPGERFPEPSAPHLVQGYDLVRRYGCFGCHEINGYDGPDRRTGPDLRSEPPYAAAAQQLAFLIDTDSPDIRGDKSDAARLKEKRAHIRILAEQFSWQSEDTSQRRELVQLVDRDSRRATAVKRFLLDGGLRGDARQLARQIHENPYDFAARTKLVEWLEKDRTAAAPQLHDASHELADLLIEPPVLSPAAQKTGALLQDVEVPGTLRRVGPSLRHVASKLGVGTLAKWIANPQSIRPTSRMPRFFGQHYHLLSSPAALRTAQEYEPVEVRAAAFYLASRSQPFAYAPHDPAVTELPDAARGKIQFETRGCLACHQHEDSPGRAIHGPNLSNLGLKLRTERGKEWLRSWLLEPDRYHRRTRMPNTLLEPMPLVGDDGKPVPRDDAGGKLKMTDPAADIAEYLLGPDWQATDDDFPHLSGAEQEAFDHSLDAVALGYLVTAFPENKARKYLQEGIPSQFADTLKGIETELLAPISRDKVLAYVGLRTISKYGCAGCHDIPGLEGAKPIGTTLADWGRKETSKIAFEHIVEYLERDHASHQPAKGARADGLTGHDGRPTGHDDASTGNDGQRASGHSLDPAEMDPDEGYFTAALLHHQREGFLRQKLRQPRSYDYEKAENKPYNDRLRMPQFPWGANAANDAKLAGKSDVEVEAAREQAANSDIQDIMTFVLGLVAEPPASQYIYHPNPRRNAIVQGEKVLQKFNCAGCHMLDLDHWKISYLPGDFEAPPAAPLYPFLDPRFTPEEVYHSNHPDWRGRLHGELTGMLRTDPDGDPEVMAWVEDDGEFYTLKEYQADFKDPPKRLGYNVELWQPTVLGGNRFLVKDPLPTISQSMIEKHYPARGGDFARLLLPIAVQLARKTEPGATGPDAWAWVPPPLIGQGLKTKESWLTQFLLDPYRIRPGVLLRMPKFNMSEGDAVTLAQYFSAKAHAAYPQDFEAQSNPQELDEANIRYQEHLQSLGIPPSTRFEDALKIVVNKAGCIACHRVSDQMPEGSARGNGPNLGDVYRRLQRGYMHRWIAKPSFVLPYTKMQELIPYNPSSPTLGGFSLPILDAEDKPVLDADGNPKSIQVYHGTSFQQLDALVDLLANYDRYVESQTSIRDKVRQQQLNSPGGRAPAAKPAAGSSR